MDLFQKKKTNSGKFISKYLDNIWRNVLDGETGFVFFNSTEEEFSKYIDDYLDSLGSELIVLEENIKEFRYQNPYYPFLDFVKEKLRKKKDVNLNDYLEEVGVYPLQRPVFANFIKDKSTERKEEILFEELKYEKQQMLKSLKSFFNKFAKSMPMVVIVKNLHRARPSTLKFIEYLLEDDCEGRIMFVFSFIQDISLSQKSKKKDWESFLEGLYSQHMIIDLESISETRNNKNNYRSYLPQIEELIDLSNDCFNFLALQEAKDYIVEAYDRYEETNYRLKEEYYLKMLNLLGDIHNYLDENGNALIYYQSIVNYLQQRKGTRDLADAYRKIAVIHFKKYNMKTADKLANQSLKLAQEVKDELQMFKAYFLICLIEEKWRTYTNKQWRYLYNNLIELGKKLGLDNTLARCYTYFYAVNDYEVNDVLSYYNKAIEIAKKYNNEYRMAVAYHTRAILYTREENYKKVLKYYKKSKRLKEKIGDQASLAFIYNGLGYYHFLVEDYKEAYKYYNKALSALRKVKDYHEIGMTCFNLGMNSFLAFEHEEAVFYLNKVIEILRNSQVKNLMYHSKSRIYTLLGINYLKIGNLNKVQECIIKIDARGAVDITDEEKSNLDFFLLEFFMGLIFKEESNYEEARKHFEWALKLCNDIKANNDYLYPRFYYEYGLMCKELGAKKKADNLFNKGLEHSKSLGYNFHKDLILTEMTAGERKEVDEFNFKGNNFNFDWIPESVELEETLDKLYQQIDKINFLNNLQNILVKASEKKSLVTEVMELIEDNFLIEASYLYLKEEGRWENYFTDEEEVDFEFNIKEFINHLMSDATEKIILNPEENYSPQLAGQFNSLVFVPLESDMRSIGCIFCGTISKELVLTNDDLKILSIAAKQLSIALERIERDQELKEAYQQLLVASKTDSLTGIYNRRQLRKKLVSERKRAKRYGNKYSVMFIDLDNFKYYNDQFGHDVGDLVLCKFAELLEVETREVDFVSRFGGDEFVLVLPETTAEEAYMLAERIQEKIIKLNQFQPDIEEVVEEEVEIPRENRLSCSIGIAEYIPELSEENKRLLKLADEAVYKAKENGKNQIKKWKEER